MIVNQQQVLCLCVKASLSSSGDNTTSRRSPPTKSSGESLFLCSIISFSDSLDERRQETLGIQLQAENHIIVADS
jgi:hypothetical protein